MISLDDFYGVRMEDIVNAGGKNFLAPYGFSLRYLPFFSIPLSLFLISPPFDILFLSRKRGVEVSLSGASVVPSSLHLHSSGPILPSCCLFPYFHFL